MTQEASTEAHYHDCVWGAGHKHICFQAECAEIADEPPVAGASFHGQVGRL